MGEEKPAEEKPTSPTPPRASTPQGAPEQKQPQEQPPTPVQSADAGMQVTVVYRGNTKNLVFAPTVERGVKYKENFFVITESSGGQWLKEIAIPYDLIKEVIVEKIT